MPMVHRASEALPAGTRLALRAEEGRPLPLHDAADGRTTGRAGLVSPAVDAMPLLKSAQTTGGCLVELVSDRRAFQTHGLGENGPRHICQPVPDLPRQPMAGSPRVEARAMENFCRVDIADAGHGPLIEERDLDRPAGAGQSPAEVVTRDDQTVGAESRLAAGAIEPAGIDQPERAKPALIPKYEGVLSSLAGMSHVHHQPHVISRRWRHNEHEPRHPRLDHQPSLAGWKRYFEGEPLPKPFDGRKPAPPDPRDNRGWNGRRADRSLGPAWEFGPRDPTANKMEDAAAHCLDFGELGHGGRLKGLGSLRDGSHGLGGYNQK